MRDRGSRCSVGARTPAIWPDFPYRFRTPGGSPGEDQPDRLLGGGVVHRVRRAGRAPVALTYKWACYRHPHKPKRWIINRYLGRYNTARQDRWAFGDRTSGAYLLKFAWTKIVRHSLVRGDASPDNPPKPTTGPTGVPRANPRSTAEPCTCCAGSTGPDRSADTCSCTPTASLKAPTNGSSGTAPPARRSPGNTWSSSGRAYRTKLDSFTPPATAGPPAHGRTRHPCTPEIAQAACLSRVPRRVARTV